MRLNGIVCGTMTGWALTQIGKCWIGPMIDFLHIFAMLPDTKMRYGFHLALLKDFGSLASWMSVRSHEFAPCPTASPLLSVVS